MPPTARTTSLLLLALLAAACGPQEAAPPAPPAPALPTLAPAPTPFGPAAGYGSDPLPTGAFVFYEDFERGFDRWTLPDAAAPVTFRQLNAPTCGGLWTILLGTADHAPFVPTAGEHVLALKAPIDLGKARRPYFKYDVKGTTRPEAALDLVAELRGRDGAWTPVGRRVRGGYVFMASIGADLTAWAGQLVDLRFRAVLADGEGPSGGLYLDDIQIIEPR